MDKKVEALFEVMAKRSTVERKVLASTASVADERSHLDVFKKTFHSFPLRMQQIVLSYYIEKKSVKEIALEIGCSISTTRVDLHKGRHRLVRRC